MLLSTDYKPVERFCVSWKRVPESITFCFMILLQRNALFRLTASNGDVHRRLQICPLHNHRR